MKKNKIILVLGFIFVIFVFFVLNFKYFFSYINTNENNKENITYNLENNFKNSFKYKNKFIDVYGLFNLILDKKIIGNFEFVKDNHGFMHMVFAKPDAEKRKQEIKNIKSLCDKKNIPFLYVQIPPRVVENYTKVPNIIYDYNQIIDDTLKFFDDNNIQYIDIRKHINNGKLLNKEIYFKTDMHMTTEGELAVLKLTIAELEKENIMYFENKDIILNENNYIKIQKDFHGNFSASSGKFYTKKDNFLMLIPKFETNFLLKDNTAKTLKSGNFENVVMNGHHNDEQFYWVINYLQWPNACYNIENTLKDKNNILVIMDSLSMRMVSYLSLMCNNVTIIDPRYDSRFIFSEIYNKKYDLVLLLNDEDLFRHTLSALSAEIESAEIENENTPREIYRGQKYNISIIVKNTSTESWSEKKNIRLCIFQDSKDCGYRIKIPKNIEILPGDTYEFVLNDFEAPPNDKTYLEFQMVEEGINWFGEKKRVDISVK